MIKTHKVESGFAVSEGGTWLPGCYETAEAAKLACTKDCDALDALVKSCPEGFVTREQLDTI